MAGGKGARGHHNHTGRFSVPVTRVYRYTGASVIMHLLDSASGDDIYPYQTPATTQSVQVTQEE